MYATLQAAIKTRLETEFGADTVYLEDQPNTPEVFQSRLNSYGWAILIGEPIIQKEGLFLKVYFPIQPDENRTVNRASESAPNRIPREVAVQIENVLRGYQPSDIWVPIKLSQQEKMRQIFPEGGKSPWLLVVETKTIPVQVP